MDVLNDQSHRRWITIAEAHNVPSYVYDQEVPVKEAYADAPDSLFADPVHRMFPIDTPATTWLAAAYFNDAGGQIKQADLRECIRDRIVRAAETYGIAGDVKTALDLRAAEPVNPEDVDANYAYVVKDAAGKTASRRYGIFDRDGLEKACSYFSRNRSAYQIEERTKIAAGILRRALELGGPDVPELVHKEAADAVPYRPALLQELFERARLTKDAEASTIIGTLVEVVGFATSDELIKNADALVAVIDDLDKLNGMTKHYGRDILSPNEVVYAMPVKDAEALMDDTVTLDRIAFSSVKLAELDPSVFGDVLGEDFIAQVSKDGKLDAAKMAAILPTLPRPDRAVLEASIVRQCTGA